jgi:protein-L-isoaspartate O-methyltransferase
MTRMAGTKRESFWTDRTVAWYERANDRSDYAVTILDVVADLLERCDSALDVGAGFGALTVPLARRLSRVTALEPAPAMARALERAAERHGLRNLVVVEAGWDSTRIVPHDLVVCAHVGPLLGRDSTFLSDVLRVAGRGVLLVRDAPAEGEDKFFFTELYPRLLGQRYERSCDHEETLETLSRLGVRPVTTLVRYRSDQPFVSLDEACDFWMDYMGLEGASRAATTPSEARAFLRTFLERRLRREGDHLVAPFQKRVAVIHWSVSPGGSEA